MSTVQNTICFVAGKSGGHIIPALTLAQAPENHDKNILFISTNTALDSSIIDAFPTINHRSFNLRGLSRNPFGLLLFALQFLRIFVRTFFIFRRFKPERIISMGGAISIPVCLMGWLMRIPIDLYELNTTPGKAITFLARFATTIYVCFAQTKVHFKKKKCIVTPYPLRFPPDVPKTTAVLLHPHFQASKKTIFITGGSQGSLFINRLIKQWLSLNPHMHALIQIIHQTGSSDTTDWQSWYDSHEIPVLVFSYQDNLLPYYQAADIIVGRAGAGTLFEALFFKKTCLVIPLEIASTRHQKDNAYAMAQQYPALFSIITEQSINQDNSAFFKVINKYIYGTLAVGYSKPNLKAP